MLKVAHVEEKLLEPGLFKGTVNWVSTPHVTLSNFDMSNMILQEGVGTPGYITFTIFEPTVSFTWRNHDMRDGMIGVLWKNEHQSVSDSGFKITNYNRLGSNWLTK